jgi:hypothetical protein
MGKSLTVKNEPLTSLHWVIYVEVLHTEDILVNIELAQIPGLSLAANIRWGHHNRDLPNHRAKGFHGITVMDHVSDGLWY